MGDARESLSTVEQLLRISFKNRELLRLALTHTSYVNEHPEEAQGSNERLEFLGDALLDLVVAQEFYKRYPDMDEGQLTQLRSAVVRGETLAGVARRLEVGRHLRLGHGEAASGGGDRDSNLAGALEALVGAVFLDRGYRGAASWVRRILRRELRRTTDSGVPQEPKTRLQERAHRQGLQTPEYRLVDMEGPEHQRSFVVEVLVGGNVMGRGAGGRKAEAERRAAEEALKAIP